MQLCAGLKVNSMVRVLILRLNGVSDGGAGSIGGLLRVNGTITELDLAGNDISDVGCSAIAAGATSSPSLTRLVLSSNAIGSGGAEALAAMICHNRRITTLYLAKNLIGDEGMVALAGALEAPASSASASSSASAAASLLPHSSSSASLSAAHHTPATTLTRLDVSSNSGGRVGSMALCHALRHNKGIRHIALDLFDRACADELEKALAENKGVTEVNVSGPGSAGLESTLGMYLDRNKQIGREKVREAESLRASSLSPVPHSSSARDASTAFSSSLFTPSSALQIPITNRLKALQAATATPAPIPAPAPAATPSAQTPTPPTSHASTPTAHPQHQLQHHQLPHAQGAASSDLSALLSRVQALELSVAEQRNRADLAERAVHRLETAVSGMAGREMELNEQVRRLAEVITDGVLLGELSAAKAKAAHAEGLGMSALAEAQAAAQAAQAAQTSVRQHGERATRVETLVVSLEETCDSLFQRSIQADEALAAIKERVSESEVRAVRAGVESQRAVDGLSALEPLSLSIAELSDRVERMAEGQAAAASAADAARDTLFARLASAEEAVRGCLARADEAETSARRALEENGWVTEANIAARAREELETKQALALIRQQSASFEAALRSELAELATTAEHRAERRQREADHASAGRARAAEMRIAAIEESLATIRSEKADASALAEVVKTSKSAIAEAERLLADVESRVAEKVGAAQRLAKLEAELKRQHAASLKAIESRAARDATALLETVTVNGTRLDMLERMVRADNRAQAEALAKLLK